MYFLLLAVALSNETIEVIGHHLNIGMRALKFVPSEHTSVVVVTDGPLALRPMRLVANAFEHAAEVPKASRLADMECDLHDAPHRNDAHAMNKPRCFGRKSIPVLLKDGLNRAIKVAHALEAFLIAIGRLR